MCEADLKKIISDIVYNGADCSARIKTKRNRAERNVSYEASYLAIRNWCAAQDKWTAESCLILANIVFGWIPATILFHTDSAQAASDFQREDNGAVVVEKMAEKIAEMVNTNEFISDQTGTSIDVLKHFLKNSYVAASKFLHFIYPHHYAMWDRNVLSALKSKKPSISMKTDNLSDFLLYQKAIMLFVSENSEKSLREVELLLFKAGQKKSETEQ